MKNNVWHRKVPNNINFYKENGSNLWDDGYEFAKIIENSFNCNGNSFGCKDVCSLKIT